MTEETPVKQETKRGLNGLTGQARQAETPRRKEETKDDGCQISDVGGERQMSDVRCPMSEAGREKTV